MLIISGNKSANNTHDFVETIAMNEQNQPFIPPNYIIYQLTTIDTINNH